MLEKVIPGLRSQNCRYNEKISYTLAGVWFLFIILSGIALN